MSDNRKGSEEFGDVDQSKIPRSMTPMDIDGPAIATSNLTATSNNSNIACDSSNNNYSTSAEMQDVLINPTVSAMPGDGSGDGESSNATKSMAANQRCMKKDDSGISVEKQADSDDELSQEEERVTEGKGKGLSKLDVKKTDTVTDKSSPDSGHHECIFEPDYLETRANTETDESETSKIKLQQHSVINDSDDDDDDDNVVDELMSKSRRFDKELIDSLMRRMDAKDSDDDEEKEKECDDEKKDGDNKSSGKASDDEDENTGSKLKPRHSWFLCPEVIDRQYGVANRFQNDLFGKRCCGSLHAVERLELMYKMKRHDGCVNSLHFNCSGTRLASGSDDLNVVLWDWTIDHPVLVYDSGHRSNIFQAKFIPFSGDCHVVSCARDGQVRLAELSSTGICKGTRRLAQHRGPAHKLALNFDSPQTFLSCGEDALVYEIDLRESKPEKLLICKENERKVALYTIFVNPGNSYEFAIGGRDHFVRVYDKRKIAENDGTLKMFCPQHLLLSEVRANVTCLVYNYDGSEILATYNDEDIYTFDSSHSDGADYTHKYQGHRNNATVKGVNYFGTKSEFIVSGSDCGNIYMWEHDSEQVVNYMQGDEGGVVNCLEPHPHLPILATSGLDDDVKIWMPSCENPPKLAGLKSIMQANKKGREEDRRREPETIDGQMLWYFMHHLRRTARRRARQTGQNVAEETSSDENSEDSDDTEDVSPAVQCAPS